MKDQSSKNTSPIIRKMNKKNVYKMIIKSFSLGNLIK